MEEYDEDLSENPWYLAFVHGQSKLFDEITGERWIVCVPKFGSWKGQNDVPKTISASNFQSHCMKYDGEECTSTMLANGIDIQRKIHRYMTHNGKTLLVEGSKVSCSHGFEESATSFNSKSGLLNLPSGGLNHHAKILFEETYFNANDQSYKMLCISRPLEIHLASEDDTEKKDESGTNDAIGYEKSSLSSRQLWSKASRPEKLKKTIDGKIANYIKHHGVGKMTTANAMPNLERTDSLELDEITGLDACEAGVDFLFKSCFEVVKKDSKIKKEIDTNPVDVTEITVEKYILQEVYGSVSRQIASSVANQESSFNKKICNLSDVQPRDLEIDEKYWLSLPRAKRHISRMNKCCTPYDKLACIQRTISCITAKQDIPKEDALGSDDLLPILIYLLIKSGIPNWITNLVYMKRFKFVPSNNEQSSYFAATLEAAIEHVNSPDFKLSSKAAADKFDDDMIYEYFKKVREGDVEGVRRILSQSAVQRREIERQFCHPLCVCDECSKLKRSKSLSKAENIVSIHTRNEKGQTALHVAALLGRHELVDVLLETGADINAIDYHGSTPLHCAALSGSQSVVFLLLHHGANQSAKDNNNNTPLHLCCQRGHETCAKAILYFDPSVHIASVNMDNDDGDTPLHVASRWGYVGIVSALIESGADPKAVNRRRQSTVDVSLNENVSHTIKDAANQVIKIVRTLRYLQANTPKALPSPAKTPEKKKARSRAATPKDLDNSFDIAYNTKQVEKLFRAVNDNDLHMVRFLCGWQTTGEDNESKSLKDTNCHPLCQCTKCQPQSSGIVLHANSANQEKYTGIMLAAKNGFLEMTQLFLEHGASVNVRTKMDGFSPLHFACKSMNIEILRAILSADGTNPDIRDENGSTPLYVCAINNFVEGASLLMEHNASLNIRNRKGDAPLHFAVKWKNIDIVKLFLEHGALLYYKNNDGLTPDDLAEQDINLKTILNMGSLVKSSSPTSLSLGGVSPHTPCSSPHDVDISIKSEYNNTATDDSHFYSQRPPTPPLSGNASMTTSSDQVDYSSTCKDCQCLPNGEMKSTSDHSHGVLARLPSTTSDIFHDIGVEHTHSIDAEVGAHSDCENERSKLLSKECDDMSFVSDAFKSSEESSSKQTVDSERYFEMG